MYAFSLFLLYLALYSFLGWIAEVLYVFATTRHLQNRGFLTGPFLPIYGFGAILLLLLVYPYVNNPFLVFLASVVITSALEFFTHLVLDKLFHIKLWDYSNRPFNLQGRICLQNSLAFGGLGLLLLYVIHPVAKMLLGSLPQTAAIAIAWSLLGILAVDAANSIRSLAKVRPVLDEVKGTLDEAHARIEQTAQQRYEARNEKRSASDAAHSGTLARLARAFPHARSNRAPDPVIDPRAAREA
jgi:uncharacterized membrane protein